ncbi:aldehyde dehydrogenase family protein [Dasania marina]|uniref:aldehyde dehydrogenase family protein n=1 Tax=Dasania marina TaxID=471499 RepID=UPI00036DCC45|nr:aldehyde dehydrogenase family protein [Dasania marina]
MPYLESLELQNHVADSLLRHNYNLDDLPDIFTQVDRENILLDSVKAFIAKPKGCFIGGEWMHSDTDSVIPVYEPFTGKVLNVIPNLSVSEVDEAVVAARKAFANPEWRGMKPMARQAMLLRLSDLVEENAEQLAQIESLDNGKSITGARAELSSAINHIRYMAGWCSKIEGKVNTVSASGQQHAYTLKEPVGVVAGIIPWNFPLVMAVWKIIPALVTGCTVILKPAEQTPLSALRLAELIAEAGFPKGVVNVITGTGVQVGAALASHPGINKIAFTGSTAVGKSIGKSAMENITRVSLELGGKSPLIVFADADIDKVIKGAANAIFYNQGQVCCAGSRLYIHRDIHDKVVAGIAAIADSLTLASGLDASCGMAPLVSKPHQLRVNGYIAQGLSEGAKLATKRSIVEGDGYFVAPTVLTDTHNAMAVVREEIFGPVLVVQAFEDEEEALRLANDSSYGLGASIWSNDLTRVHRLIPQIEAGVVWVNTHNLGDPSQPFGGYKQSGIGREQGREQLDMFLETKSVWIDLN